MSASITALVVQPDGKALAASSYGEYNPRNQSSYCSVWRLNADGSWDQTFSNASGIGYIDSMVMQPDGKVLLVGDFTYINNTPRSHIARLNADGSLDATFNSGPVLGERVSTVALQPDGKVLVGGEFISINDATRNRIARLNADGSLDKTFNPGSGPNYRVGALILQPDGKVLMCGYFDAINGVPRDRIARLNVDGSLDATFIPCSGFSFSFPIALQADGKVLVCGSTNATSVGIERLNPDGSLDATFNSGVGANGAIEELTIQPDGKVLVGGNFSTFNGTSRNGIARLNADGSVDAAFNPDTESNTRLYALTLQPDGKVLIGFSVWRGSLGIERLNADGSKDASFEPGSGANSRVCALALQPDGKTLLGGQFTTINEMPRKKIARMNANGALDPTFAPRLGTSDPLGSVSVYGLELQPDGKVLVGGEFISINDVTRNRIARLNADGSLDATFNPGSGANGDVRALALQADGKVLLGGGFTSINGALCNRVARLNANGTLDAGFSSGSGANESVRALAVQGDGKILLGGYFTQINGMKRIRIARLNANGSVDTTFNPGWGPNGPIYALAVQPDGKVLLGGSFSTVNGLSRHHIARLNADGSLDATFNPGAGADDSVMTLVLQADGKVLLGGAFTKINGKPCERIARINTNGSVDTAFDTSKCANGSVHALALQADGKVLAGGDFTSIKGVARVRIARLSNPNAALPRLSVTAAGSCVTWALKGSYPQPSQVLFEQSADGRSGTWRVLGWGVAAPGLGYRLSGLSLPLKTNQYVRATGWVAGGATLCSQSVLRFYAQPQCIVCFSTNGWSGASLKGVTTQKIDPGSSSLPVTAVPPKGGVFIKWTLNGKDYSVNNPLIVTNISADLTLTAVFGPVNAVGNWHLYE